MSKKLTEIVCRKISKSRSKIPTLLLWLKWSDGTSEEKTVPFTSLFDFHNHLRTKYETNSELKIPDLPEVKKLLKVSLFGGNEGKRRIDEYFKKIISMSDQVLTEVRGFFECNLSEFIAYGYVPQSSTTSASHTEPADANLPVIDDFVQYESVNDLDIPTVRQQLSLTTPPAVPVKPSLVFSKDSTRAVATVPAAVSPPDTDEHIYWACEEYSKRHSGEVSLTPGGSVSVLQKTLTGWWFVDVLDSNEQGWAPASCLLPADRRELNDISISKPSLEFRAICDVDGHKTDEISCKKGDPIEVLDARLDGWWKVSHQGKIGFLAAVNLQQVSNEQKGLSIPRLNDPPPRRDDDTIEELYARVDKLRRNDFSATQHVICRVPDAQPAEALYAEVEPQGKLVPEFYSLPDQQYDDSGTTNTIPPSKSNHSYVNICLKVPDPSVGITPNSPTSHEPVTCNGNLSPKHSQLTADLGKGVAHSSRMTERPVKAVRDHQTAVTSSDAALLPNTSVQKKLTPPAAKPKPCKPVTKALNSHAPVGARISPKGGGSGNDNETEKTSQHGARKHFNESSSASNSLPSTSLEKKINGASASCSIPILNLSRPECDQLLTTRGKPRDFVIRESNKPGCPYAISVLSLERRVHHFPIELTPEKKYYIGHYSFDTVDDVVKYYSREILFHTDYGEDITLGQQFRLAT